MASMCRLSSVCIPRASRRLLADHRALRVQNEAGGFVSAVLACRLRREARCGCGTRPLRARSRRSSAGWHRHARLRSCGPGVIAAQAGGGAALGTLVWRLDGGREEERRRDVRGCGKPVRARARARATTRKCGREWGERGAWFDSDEARGERKRGRR
eukprot:1021594-Pleurochrysis_carterae.AAC.5